MKSKTSIAVLLFLLAGCRSEHELPTTVLIVRHAEKEANAGTDPPLSAAGRARAEALARLAENAGITAVYVTQYRRTSETAAPLLAKPRQMVMRQVPVNLSNPVGYPEALEHAILSQSAGKAVLVVSHSNTVPAIIERLAHVKVTPIADPEYDRLYIVTLSGKSSPRLVAAQYGCAALPR